MFNSTTKRATSITVARGTVTRVNPTPCLFRAPLSLSRSGSNPKARSRIPIYTIAQGDRLYSTHLTSNIKTKVVEDVNEAVKDVKSGDTLLCGGEFSSCTGFDDLRSSVLTSSAIRCRLRIVWNTRYTRATLRQMHYRALTVQTDTLIEALANRKDVNMLTAVSNNAGSGKNGLGT